MKQWSGNMAVSWPCLSKGLRHFFSSVALTLPDVETPQCSRLLCTGFSLIPTAGAAAATASCCFFVISFKKVFGDLLGQLESNGPSSAVVSEQ